MYSKSEVNTLLAGKADVNGTISHAALADASTKLETARLLNVDLESNTAASFNGEENKSLGVSGVLSVANGGTGISSPYMCHVYYSGSGDTSFTSAVVFNTVVYNIGNCYSTSTGRFTAPIEGIYFVSFGFYSNSTSTSQRPSIMLNGTNYLMTNGAYGNCISGCIYCKTNDYITAGAYNTNYPISIYASPAHNYFMVSLISKI